MRNIYPRSRPGGTAIDCVDLSDHIYLDFSSYLHAIVYLSGFRPRWHLRRRSGLGGQLHFDYFVSPLEINMSFETARTNTPPHTHTETGRGTSGAGNEDEDIKAKTWLANVLGLGQGTRRQRWSCMKIEKKEEEEDGAGVSSRSGGGGGAHAHHKQRVK